MVLKVFWIKKKVEKHVFGSKEHKPWFFSYHNGRNSEKKDDASSVFLKTIRADDISSVPGTIIKKTKMCGPWWNRSGGLAWLARPSNTWPFFFSIFFISIIFLKKLNYIYINTPCLFYFVQKTSFKWWWFFGYVFNIWRCFSDLFLIFIFIFCIIGLYF